MRTSMQLPLIRSFGNNTPPTIVTGKRFSGRLFARPESGGTLVAIDTKDGRVIGSSRFHGYNQEKSEVEIGWTFLAKSHWGGVYNGEMKRLMLRHAFRFVNSVIFLVGPQNWRSQRAVEKIGGVRVGTRPDASGRDSIIYQITASDYAAAEIGRAENSPV
ncbi:MAG TPA: GNAT family N-acetyltransferase [Bryobacteraceae bacterium]|nr:GNAT family N-acetyltransferase [Bryobacteraceae bacterium]